MENGQVLDGIFPHISQNEDGPTIEWRDYPDLARPVKNMDDGEKLDEIVYHLRTVGAAMAQFQNMGPGGIMKMLMGGGK